MSCATAGKSAEFCWKAKARPAARLIGVLQLTHADVRDDGARLLAEEPETPVDVAEINLLLATDEYPKLDVPAQIERLNAYAAKLRRRLQGDAELRVLELLQPRRAVRRLGPVRLEIGRAHV